MTLTKRKTLTVVDGGLGTAPPGGGASNPDAWKQGLTRTRDGNVEGTLHNLILILENDERFAGLWWLNESSNQVVLSRDPPWNGGNRDEFTDADSCELAAWLQNPDNYWVKCGDETVLKAVIAVARRHRRHPIREYLTAVKWDGTPRVERMLIDLFGAPDNAYSQRAAQCFAVSAVARVLWFDAKQPFVGAQVDFMLVLEGEQGKRKSSALRALFGSNWFVETSESPSGKDFYQVIQGCWGVEIGEMDSFSKADVTSVKTAITRRVDKFRAPYERVPRSYRRECVFAGTTNEHEYLRDPTGGRRFLPVRTDGEVRLDAIGQQRDQLWAEAVAMFDAGFEWWSLPEDAAEEQEARYVGDSWEGRIAKWLAGKLAGEQSYPPRVMPGMRLEWTTTDELLAYAIRADVSKHGRQEQMRVSAVMKRLRWSSERVMVDGYRERRWVRASGDIAPEPQPAGADDAPDF
ncbi:virulence factor [Xanthomonas prunicola]|uniref:VapE domain-containing protein n=1 Tax=Xanthomonas prunicola TaxID=2053930 RepID=UPI0021B17B31|nr:VapE domain-containing protein [Xanthomonas prunicola]UXA48513.1 virulence factor [Xanthomonas prunicola]